MANWIQQHVHMPVDVVGHSRTSSYIEIAGARGWWVPVAKERHRAKVACRSVLGVERRGQDARSMLSLATVQSPADRATRCTGGLEAKVRSCATGITMYEWPRNERVKPMNR